MPTAANYAAAFWAYSPRTLNNSTPTTPSTLLDNYCEAVWTYTTRTLTSVTAYTTVSIDQSWIDGHGNPPYLLNTPKVRYVLIEDVVIPGNFAGNLFSIKAKNVSVDRNGHNFITGNFIRELDNTEDIALSKYTKKANTGKDYANVGPPEDINFIKNY